MATLRNIGRRLFETDPREFAPGLARIDALPSSPLGRAVLYAVISLIAASLAWTAFASLDIVAVAEGKLVPTGYLKVVQPAEQGIVQEIAVREGETVRAGQVLARMDPVPLEAEARALASDHLARRPRARGARPRRRRGSESEAAAGAAALPRAGARFRQAGARRICRQAALHGQATRTPATGAGPEEPGIPHRRRARRDHPVRAAHRPHRCRTPQAA